MQTEGKKERRDIKSWLEMAEKEIDYYEYHTMTPYNRLLAKWAYIKESPEFQSLDFDEKYHVQKEFSELLAEPERYLSENVPYALHDGSGYRRFVPEHNDGLDDDDDELKL